MKEPKRKRCSRCGIIVVYTTIGVLCLIAGIVLEVTLGGVAAKSLDEAMKLKVPADTAEDSTIQSTKVNYYFYNLTNAAEAKQNAALAFQFRVVGPYTFTKNSQRIPKGSGFAEVEWLTPTMSESGLRDQITIVNSVYASLVSRYPSEREQLFYVGERELRTAVASVAATTVTEELRNVFSRGQPSAVLPLYGSKMSHALVAKLQPFLTGASPAQTLAKALSICEKIDWSKPSSVWVESFWSAAVGLLSLNDSKLSSYWDAFSEPLVMEFAPNSNFTVPGAGNTTVLLGAGQCNALADYVRGFGLQRLLAKGGLFVTGSPAELLFNVSDVSTGLIAAIDPMGSLSFEESQKKLNALPPLLQSSQIVQDSKYYSRYLRSIKGVNAVVYHKETYNFTSEDFNDGTAFRPTHRTPLTQRVFNWGVTRPLLYRLRTGTSSWSSSLPLTTYYPDWGFSLEDLFTGVPLLNASGIRHPYIPHPDRTNPFNRWISTPYCSFCPSHLFTSVSPGHTEQMEPQSFIDVDLPTGVVFGSEVNLGYYVPVDLQRLDQSFPGRTGQALLPQLWFKEYSALKKSVVNEVKYNKMVLSARLTFAVNLLIVGSCFIVLIIIYSRTPVTKDNEHSVSDILQRQTRRSSRFERKRGMSYSSFPSRTSYIINSPTLGLRSNSTVGLPAAQ